MTTAYVALGSNMGERLMNLGRAVDAIADLPETHVTRVSSAYESEPAYVADQPAFANAVVEVQTSLEPGAFLAYLLDIEDQMGRVRDQDKGPRVIDLDLLLFGDEEWNSDDLKLPHPGLLERGFVVWPLLEIAPGIALPDGTHPRRANVTVGKVTGELGRVPDAGVAAHGIPVTGEWVVVAESSSAVDALGGFDAALGIVKAALDDEGIPTAYDPYEPGTDLDPFGLPMTFRILVPEEYAEKAAEITAQVAAAPPDFSEVGE